MSRLTFFASALLVFLSACGGGGNNGENQLYQDGNSWTYDVSVSQGGQGTTDVLRKRVTGSVVNPSGLECKEVQYDYEHDSDEELTYYFHQDEDGSSWYCGDSIDRFVINAERNLSPMYPAYPQVGESLYSGLVYEQESGFREVCSASITGQAEIEAAGEVWQAFVMEEVCQDDPLQLMFYTKTWFNNEVGMIKAEWAEIPFGAELSDPRVKLTTLNLARAVLQ